MFYLLAIANLVSILKNLNKILDKNRGNIDNTLDKLPEITDNVAKVSDIIKEEMESIQKVVHNVGKISDSAKDAVELFKKDILLKAKGILDIIEWIRKLFEKDDKKKEIVYKYKYKPRKETVAEQGGSKGTEKDCTQEDDNNAECVMDETVSRGEQKEGEKDRQGENLQGAGI